MRMCNLPCGSRSTWKQNVQQHLLTPTGMTIKRFIHSTIQKHKQRKGWNSFESRFFTSKTHQTTGTLAGPMDCYKRGNTEQTLSSQGIQILNYPACRPLFLWATLPHMGDHGSTVVKVLCYKSEGRWFDPRWCQWIFHWHKILTIALWPFGQLSL